MNQIANNLSSLRSELPPSVKLVAISKSQPVEVIRVAYDAGQRIFGENKAQELIAKAPSLPEDIEWHFVGHLQTNKVKQILPFVSMIHSVDSVKLLKEIDKEAAKISRNINCLLQFHIAEEDTKYGLSPEEAEDILSAGLDKELKNISLSGVMGMATLTDDMKQVAREFHNLHSIFDKLRSKYFSLDQGFCEVSMGMSDDYPLAIAQGATMVRIGSKVFNV